MVEMKNTYKILAGKPEDNSLVGRRGRSLEDNIKTDLKQKEKRCGLV